MRAGIRGGGEHGLGAGGDGPALGLREGEPQPVVVVAIFGPLTADALAPDHPIGDAAKLAGYLGAFDVDALVQVAGGANNRLQAFVVARVRGVHAVVRGAGPARRARLHAHELFLILEHADHIEQRLGLVAGPVHVLRAQAVGLQFHVATVTADQFGAVHFGGGVNGAAAREHVGGAGQHLAGHAGGLAPRVMARRDMGDFMCEDAGQFGLAVQVGEQAAVDVDKAPGCGEGVDPGRIQHREGEFEIGLIAVRHQALPDLLDIGLQLGVVVVLALGHKFVVHFPARPALAFDAGEHDGGIAGIGIDRAAAGRDRQRGAQRRDPYPLVSPLVGQGAGRGVAAAAPACDALSSHPTKTPGVARPGHRRRCPVRAR